MNSDFENIYDLLRKKKYQEALSLLLNSSFEMNPKYLKDENHAWYMVGDIYYNLQDYTNALSSFQKSYSSDKKDDAALMAMANCCSDIGAYKAAELLLQSAIHVSHDTDKLYYNLGNAFFDQSDYHAAVKAYERVTENDIDTFKLAQKNIAHAKKHTE